MHLRDPRKIIADDLHRIAATQGANARLGLSQTFLWFRLSITVRMYAPVPSVPRICSFGASLTPRAMVCLPFSFSMFPSLFS